MSVFEQGEQISSIQDGDRCPSRTTFLQGAVCLLLQVQSSDIHMFHRCLTCPELKAQICQDRSLHLGEDFKENKTFFKKFKIILRNDFRYSSNQNINFYSSTVHFMLLIRVQNAGATV